ncbi:MAG: HAMP domain-containing histidine kinase [Lachnospiraceae bacterium]|nr:HAMP domain-containing histidine kinase [Lachnospiraceae bacterium]
MKKTTFKRICLELAQHLTAAGAMIVIAVILFNSYIGVTSMKESKTYWLDPLNTETEFEYTDVYNSILNTAVSDVLQLVAIREQLETDGEFDPVKYIDVTHYAGREQEGYNCDVTAVYTLENLIKWGKNGVEYNTRAMSMSNFVNYFGDASSRDNFALDENGQLYFVGFNDSESRPKAGDKVYINQAALKKSAENIPDGDYYEALDKAMSEYTTEQLEDMAFSYIMAENMEEINVQREDDGSLTVYLSILSCRYETVDGIRQLTEYAGNWIEYVKLQQNLAASIESLSSGYELYQNAMQLYSEGNTNLIYVVRLMSDNGITRTYTNFSDMRDMTDDDITEYFSEYRRYFVYYLDNLEFTGITNLTEGDIYRFMNESGYAYPENTRIWMAVDTAYTVQGDAFHDAYSVFERIVPNIVRLLGIIAILSFIWLGILGYLTLTAGVDYDEDGERIFYTHGIDRIWTEIMLLTGVALIYAGYRGMDILNIVADRVYSSHSELLGTSATKLYEYGSFGVFGGAVSIALDILWLSLVRRARCGIIWSGSFIYWILSNFRNAVHFIFSHKNTAISTLLPYNIFLLANFLGAFAAYKNISDSRMTQALFCVLGIVLMDGLVGVMLFRRNAERIDIVEGINRIRDGEVEYKLDVDSLTGTSREMADAVNNIGEGIRKAVHTSMKDEQMKTDLITNVSHDIKTPLTSIISYTDLLKRLKIEDEPAKGYIDVLDEKAQRLKQLTDDLLEASKISSGNITFNMERLNLTELLNQAVGEFSEKLEERGLTAVFEDNNVPAYINADSRRMWRIADNLFNNLCKYALENTRVYIEISIDGETVELSIKNISASRMNIKGDELTERFIRGDSSRTTEGSGLGLFIAKSLTEAQGGGFEIKLDGDLFKVVLRFPLYNED